MNLEGCSFAPFFFYLYGVVILYLYYNQQSAVNHLQKIGYDRLPFKVCFVDDGSKRPLKCDWAEVYRIDKDVKWNQPYANNHGLCQLELTDNVLRMDIDHYFTIDALHKISKIELQENDIVHFKRVYKGQHIKSHMNTFLINVGDLLNVGGYDERFCGNYGYDDVELMNRLRKFNFNFRKSEIPCFAMEQFSTKLERFTNVNFRKYHEKGHL